MGGKGRRGRAVKRIVLVTMAIAGWGVTGCSVVGKVSDEAASHSTQTRDEYARPRHGIITVAEIAPRSDIAILPPSLEHVVWVRGGGSGNGRWSEVEERIDPVTPTETAPTESAGHPADHMANHMAGMPDDGYPLLRDHGAYETEYGRVPMCLDNGLIEPCEDAHLYDCYGSKGGGYCLERDTGQ